MDWEPTEPGSSYRRIEGMDPFADWLLGSGFADFSRRDDKSLIPITIGPITETVMELLGSGRAAENGIFIPWLYRELPLGQYVVAFVTKSVFDKLASQQDFWELLRGSPKQIDLGVPLKQKSLPPEWITGAPAPAPVPPPVFQPGSWPLETVVVGIIDDGIAFAHERFRLGDGKTRVQYFWQQDGTYQKKDSTVSYGNEICKLNHPLRIGIDDLLAVHASTGLVDEERLYRDAGVADFGDPDHKAVAWRRAHGTHILDLAAGYDPRSNCLHRPIIAVQLPVSVTADTSGSNLKPYTVDAINYILERADLLAGKNSRGDPWTPLPVVINFSYGMIAGPHDGTLDIERTIDQLAATRAAPLRVVLPSGNANLSRCHATLTFKANDPPKTLHWQVQPDDLTPTFMEIWLPHDPKGQPKDSRVTIQISTPSGLISPDLLEKTGSGVELRANGVVIASAVYSYRPFPTERGVFAISLASSARLGGEPGAPTETVPAGLWTIKVTNTGLLPGQELNAWIQWDDVIYGYRRGGRQSYFESECYKRFDPVSGEILDKDDNADCDVRRAGTINAIATGQESIVIAGVQQKDLRPPKYTAAGPTTPTRGNAPHRGGPDAACVSDDSRVHFGILGAGSHSGSMVLMNGTSVAVPQIVRLVADMLGNKTPGDRDAVKQFAQNEELGNPPVRLAAGLPPPPPLDKGRSGEGRIVRPRASWPRGIA